MKQGQIPGLELKKLSIFISYLLEDSLWEPQVTIQDVLLPWSHYARETLQSTIPIEPHGGSHVSEAILKPLDKPIHQQTTKVTSHNSAWSRISLSWAMTEFLSNKILI